ncbi:MAG: DUF429 domain-containing protein [Candidatus Dormibacteria bacterium]
MTPGLRLIGADGCPGGWMVALELTDRSLSLERWSTPRLAAASRSRSVAVAVLDIPIGLTAEGPRACDLAARRSLGRPRGSSVFPAPLRPMLSADSYQEAQRVRRGIDGRGCSRQAFGIQARVAEVDRLIRGRHGHKFHEGHPELAFQALSGGATDLASKHTREGRLARWQLLRPDFPILTELDPGPVKAADALDAFACLWTARRVESQRAEWLPRGADQFDPELEVPMRIWF